MTLSVHYAARSDVGLIREGNEDSAYAGPRLLAVADGMGGPAAGEVASAITIGVLAELDEDEPGSDLLAVLASAAAQANSDLRTMMEGDKSLDGMGTTLTALLFAGSRVGVMHVGDSRGYLLRGGDLVQITHDHSLVQSLIDEGRLTEDEASTHPQRSLITRALDGRSDLEPDLSVREARPGDRYLLCTDGLSGVVSTATLRETLAAGEPAEVVDRLVDLALRGGGPDNVTCIVADITDTSAPAAATPLVIGAAAHADTRPLDLPSSDTSAGRAALAHRASRPPPDDDTEPTDADTDPADGPPARHHARTLRRAAVVSLVVVAVLVALGAGAWAYVRTQYYVGFDADSHVAIFQGVSGSVAGLDLARVQTVSGLTASMLQPAARDKIAEGISAGDRADAERIVRGLVDRVRTPSTPATQTPTGSPTPCPTPNLTTPFVPVVPSPPLPGTTPTTAASPLVGSCTGGVS